MKRPELLFGYGIICFLMLLFLGRFLFLQGLEDLAEIRPGFSLILLGMPAAYLWGICCNP